MERKEEIREMLRKALRSVLPSAETRFILFGSQARSEELVRADFDIGILNTTSIPAAVMVRLRDTVDDLPMLYPVDLVDLSIVPEGFRSFAISSGEDL
jgi:predicted nucleotidyltransferase